MRALSTFRILPRMGRMACGCGDYGRPWPSLPAELASTMNNSLSHGSRGGTVDELARKSRSVEGGLPAGEIGTAVCAAMRARAAVCRLLHDLVGLTPRILLEPLGQLLVGGPLDERPDGSHFRAWPSSVPRKLGVGGGVRR